MYLRARRAHHSQCFPSGAVTHSHTQMRSCAHLRGARVAARPAATCSLRPVPQAPRLSPARVQPLSSSPQPACGEARRLPVGSAGGGWRGRCRSTGSGGAVATEGDCSTMRKERWARFAYMRLQIGSDEGHQSRMPGARGPPGTCRLPPNAETTTTIGGWVAHRRRHCALRRCGGCRDRALPHAGPTHGSGTRWKRVALFLPDGLLLTPPNATSLDAHAHHDTASRDCTCMGSQCMPSSGASGRPLHGALCGCALQAALPRTPCA